MANRDGRVSIRHVMGHDTPPIQQLHLPHRMRVPEDTESELTISCCTDDGLKVPIVDLLAAIQVVVDRASVNQPMQRLFIFAGRQDLIPDLVNGLPLTMRGSLHELCVKYPYCRVSTVAAPFPFASGLSLPSLDTMKLERVPITLNTELSGLTSLQLTNCTNVQGWDHLTHMTRMSELAIVMQDCEVNHIMAADALCAVGKLTWLTSLKLIGFLITSAFPDNERMTAIRSLSLGCRAEEPDAEYPGVQGFLHRLCARSPKLSHLGLDLPRSVTVPMVASLTSLSLPHLSPFLAHALPGVTRLIIRRTPGYSVGIPYPIPPSFASLSHLTHLRASYTVLPATVVVCPLLVELILEPPTPEFHDTDQDALISSLGAGTWPSLDRILFLRDVRQNCVYPLDGYGEFRRQERFAAEFVLALARRVEGIRQATLEWGGLETGRALVRLPSLQGVTFENSLVDVDLVASLARRPTMKVIEFVEGQGITWREARFECYNMVELVWKRGGLAGGSGRFFKIAY